MGSKLTHHGNDVKAFCVRSVNQTLMLDWHTETLGLTASVSTVGHRRPMTERDDKLRHADDRQD